MAITPGTTLRLAAIGIGAIAVLAAFVELARIAPGIAGDETTGADPHGATLARCRDLTPEEYATSTDCPAAWEAARQRFFDLVPDQNITPAGTE